MKKITLLLVLILAAGTVLSQDTRITGVAFGDYFYKVSGDSSGSPLEFSPYTKDFNSFEFRRVYLGVQHDINKDFTAEVILSYEGKDFSSAGNRGIFIKNAQLTWKNIFKNSNLIVGLTSTPGFSMTEKFWGYRSVEKTIMDQRGILSSRDIGIVLGGTIDEKQTFGYNIMIGNGRGTRLENNKYKKFYGHLFTTQLDKKLQIELYSDYEPVSSERSRTTFKGFTGYKAGPVSIGVEGFQQMQKNFVGDSLDIKPFGISAFITGNLVKEKLNFFARYDYFDPDTENTTSGFKENFITVGLDIMPKPNVHIMPNVWINTYSDKSTLNVERDADLVPRISFWYVY